MPHVAFVDCSGFNNKTMVTLTALRKLALSFPETTEEPHFEKTSFRVRSKIFVTYDASNSKAVVKLSEIDQHVFAAGAPAVIYPIDNKWGKQGWTVVDMKKVRVSLFKDALTTAYYTVAPQRLAELVRPGSP